MCLIRMRCSTPLPSIIPLPSRVPWYTKPDFLSPCGWTTIHIDQCEMYGVCGPYASCSINDSPLCQCLPGFRPKSLQAWDSSDWSQGCVPRIPLNCSDEHGFIKYKGIKVPDTTYTLVYEKNVDLEVCITMCLRNCSCTAYTNSDIRGGGSGCVMWFGDLIDIRQFPTGGQDLYIRLAAQSLGN